MTQSPYRSTAHGPESACADRIWRRSWRHLRPSASSKFIPRITWAADRRSPLWSGSAATGRSACMASVSPSAAPTVSMPAISPGWRRWSSACSRVLVSEHLSWSIVEGVYLNDLLPLPYTEEALDITARHIDQVQARLGRPILVENPSSYLRYRHSTIEEPAFLAELARRTGCGLLCDINNIHVSGRNLGFDPLAYLEALPAAAIGEFHLAGHSINDVDGQEILIDDHGSAVAEPVWALYRAALARFGPRPTLVEWDSRLPELSVLLDEAAKADAASTRSLQGGRKEVRQ